MNDAQSLSDLFAYNTWGNGRVFEVCRGLDPAEVRSDAPGTAGTIEETLKHMVVVEEAYLQMLRGGPVWSAGSRDEYFDHDLAWFEQRSRQLGSEYQALIDGEGPDFFEADLNVPWFDFRLTKRDGLLQVLTHSAQHRTQVLSALGARGVEVPNMDYVFFVGSRNGST